MLSIYLCDLGPLVCSIVVPKTPLLIKCNELSLLIKYNECSLLIKSNELSPLDKK
jgi:hypothetical protein